MTPPRLLIAFACLALLGSAAVADVINVPGDYTLIQDAIDASSDGDVIQIAAGTYYEGSRIKTFGKAITIKGQADIDNDGLPETVLDGSNTHRVLLCRSGETHSTIFENLVIQNGRCPPGIADGVGMKIQNSSPTLNNCVFTNNVGDTGAALLCYEDSSPVLNDCTFTCNEAKGSGGAIKIAHGNPILTNCKFWNNSANKGGAVAIQGRDYSTATLNNCSFHENSVTRSGNGNLASGGGLYLFYGNAQLSGCTFTNNSSVDFGGGIGIYEDNDADVLTLQSCLLCQNNPDQINGNWIDEIDNCVSSDCADCDLEDATGACMVVNVCIQLNELECVDQGGIFYGAHTSCNIECLPGCSTDLNGDWVIGIDDLLLVIDGWNTALGDTNLDGLTNITDLLLVIDHWNQTCP